VLAMHFFPKRPVALMRRYAICKYTGCSRCVYP